VYGGVAMIAVGGAWPLLLTLTPASDRPWVSGTSDNSIWSLIFGYNGLGRVAGQTGGPSGGGGPGGGGGFGGNLFGGATGPLRLLHSGLGDQAGWLLGFAVVAGLAILVLSRLRRRDPRTGWLMAVGGAFLVTAVVFSSATGIFHPYYVSFLAPFVAALVGAGVGLMLPRSLGGASSETTARVIAPLAIGAGAVSELIVLGGLGGALHWATPVLIGIAGACAVLLALEGAGRARPLVLAVAMAALLAAPGAWAVETLGHATSSTFPAGGPASASVGGGPGPGFRGFRPGSAGAFAPPRGGGGFGNDAASLTAAERYAQQHGGGTIGVESQSTAAQAVVSSNANVAGLGGFSGRESSVSVTWLAHEIATGRLRWMLLDGARGGGLPGDTRTGSQTAFDLVARTCPAVTLSTGGTTVKMYDCQGRAAAILQAATG
jgi:4-amino-4-deoxy-L-arabinose transferase-like glycosyltransferase